MRADQIGQRSRDLVLSRRIQAQATSRIRDELVPLAGRGGLSLERLALDTDGPTDRLDRRDGVLPGGPLGTVDPVSIGVARSAPIRRSGQAGAMSAGSDSAGIERRSAL